MRHLEQKGQRRPLPPRVPETMHRLHLAPYEARKVAYWVLVVLEVRVVLAKAGRGVGSVAGRGGGRPAIAAAGVASHDAANIGGRRCAVGQVDVGMEIRTKVWSENRLCACAMEAVVVAFV